MSSKWITTVNSTDRVKTLLEQAGVPLEIQAKVICEKFTKDKHSSDFHISSDHIVYETSDTPNEYREVDRLISIYDTFKLNKIAATSLTLNMPIECKYRKDVEVFSFATSDEDVHNSFPICGDFRGSELFDLLKNSLAPLSIFQSSVLVFLDIKDGQTPQKVYEENLTYNAAGSLYDFALSDMTTFVTIESSWHDSILDELKIFDVFDREIGSTTGNWYDFLDRWAVKQKDNLFTAFNEKYFNNKVPSGIDIHAYLPIVCINGPIYEVKWNSPTDIDNFTELPYCVTVIRKKGWPGSIYHGLLNRTPELPVIVTNAANLRSVLDMGMEWFQSIRSTLLGAPEEIVKRYPLEASIFKKALRQYKARDEKWKYRSDFHFDMYP